MKIIKSKSMMFLLIFLFIFTAALTLQKMWEAILLSIKILKTSEKDISEKESAYLWLKDTTILIMKQLS